jgi:Flp pilus assembly protein TadG
VAPVLFLLVFGIIDLGRAIYVWVTIQEAANEGARVAAVESTPLANNAAVATRVNQQGSNVVLATTCPNGPVTSAVPPPNTGWIFITQQNPPATQTTSQPLPANAPGGEPAAPAAGACSAVNPTFGNAELQLTIRYNFVPYTPLIQQAAANRIILVATAVYRSEY